VQLAAWGCRSILVAARRCPERVHRRLRPGRSGSRWPSCSRSRRSLTSSRRTRPRPAAAWVPPALPAPRRRAASSRVHRATRRLAGAAAAPRPPRSCAAGLARSRRCSCAVSANVHADRRSRDRGRRARDSAAPRALPMQSSGLRVSSGSRGAAGPSPAPAERPHAVRDSTRIETAVGARPHRKVWRDALTRAAPGPCDTNERRSAGLSANACAEPGGELPRPYHRVIRATGRRPPDVRRRMVRRAASVSPLIPNRDSLALAAPVAALKGEDDAGVSGAHACRVEHAFPRSASVVWSPSTPGAGRATDARHSERGWEPCHAGVAGCASASARALASIASRRAVREGARQDAGAASRAGSHAGSLRRSLRARHRGRGPPGRPPTSAARSPLAVSLAVTPRGAVAVPWTLAGHPARLRRLETRSARRWRRGLNHAGPPGTSRARAGTRVIVAATSGVTAPACAYVHERAPWRDAVAAHEKRLPSGPSRAPPRSGAAPRGRPARSASARVATAGAPRNTVPPRASAPRLVAAPEGTRRIPTRR
jgi:hypothetical protein